MANSISSVDLSVLSFALNAWLDGSAQLRRSLILFPLDLAPPDHEDEASNATQTQEQQSLPGNEQPSRLVECLRWFTKPARDLDEVEKAILGALDLSSSVLLLKLLGSGPILPFLLNPLSITLALPRKISIGSVRWLKVVLLCLLLSTLHEAQRTSVAAGLTWLRLKRAARDDTNIGEVILRGERLQTTDEDEEEEPCVICSGGQSDASMSDSISSLASISSLSSHSTFTSQAQSQPSRSTPDPGPLEAFCVHAPNKHPMHRSCFLAWKDAYWENRSSRPVITLLSEDFAVPLPDTWQWRRAQAILCALGSRIWNRMYYIPLSPSELSASEGVIRIGESVFTLRCPATANPGANARSGTSSSDELGNMVSSWPPCPVCRSAVKIIFARARPIRPPGSSRRGGKGLLSQLLAVWVKSWNQLVTGRTILVKTATQVVFAAFLVSMMRMRTSHMRAKLNRGASL